MADKDRRQPILELSAERTSRSRMAEVRLTLAEPGSDRANPAGIRDVRLFCNGTLVKYWTGVQKPGVYTTQVRLVSGENRIAAYAFNSQNVKSKDALVSIVGDFPPTATTGHVLAVGIDHYQGRPELSLACAKNDACSLSAAMVKSLPVDSVRTKVLLDGEARKAAILSALQAIAETAGPEDTVVISFAGHGVLADHKGQPHFFIVPHDVAGLKDPVSRSISDTELETALLGVNAQKIALVLDTCHSGGALDAPEWRRGPMNSRSLAQLAWEKGMSIVAASQSLGVAKEAGEHGILTNALLQGLTKAERQDDGRVLVESWLDCATRLVPELAGSGPDSTIDRAVSLWKEPEGAQLQTPRVFHSGKRWAISRGEPGP